MKKIALILATALIATSAMAQQFTTTVQTSDCMLVSKQSSAAGAVAGGAIGATAGAAIGGYFFGKNGRTVGGLLGATGGAVAGDSIGSNSTYSCIVQVKSPSGEVLYGKVTSTKKYVQGEQVQVTKTQNEVFIK